MIASLAAGSCSEIRNAVEDFLRLVWTPGDARPDLLPLIRALDRLAWLACGCKFDFDDACYPEPPARMNSRAFFTGRTLVAAIPQWRSGRPLRNRRR